MSLNDDRLPPEIVTGIVVVALAAPVLLILVIIFSWALGGCAEFQEPGLSEWNKSVPAWPCGPNDPRLRPDGYCCEQWNPNWNGPDQTGHYYCEVKQSDPDDPTHMYDPP